MRHNGVPYNGINVVMLSSAAVTKGYACPLWLTFKQAIELGGHVRKGEAGELVTKWMSRRLVSVRETTPLVEVARVMCDGHWHRVTVVDDSGRLKGIVSTMDVLAALVQAADEQVKS